MTIREMFQKIEKAGFADIQVTRDGDGLEIEDRSGSFKFVCNVYKNITTNHCLVYTLDIETGEQCVDEMKADDNRGDFKLVGRTYLDDDGKPITTKQRLEAE